MSEATLALIEQNEDFFAIGDINTDWYESSCNGEYRDEDGEIAPLMFN